MIQMNQDDPTGRKSRKEDDAKLDVGPRLPSSSTAITAKK